MINIKFEDKTYPLRNEITEMTIGEFESISAILNDKSRDHIDKWYDIFILLDIPSEVVDNMDSFAFIEIVKEFNFFNTKIEEIVKSITLNGHEYVSYDEKFKLTVKEMKVIEHYINKNQNRYLGELLAVIYKRQDIDSNLHTDKSHIHYKAELIRKEVKADVAVPLLAFLSKKLIKDEAIINAQ